MPEDDWVARWAAAQQQKARRQMTHTQPQQHDVERIPDLLRRHASASPEYAKNAGTGVAAGVLGWPGDINNLFQSAYDAGMVLPGTGPLKRHYENTDPTEVTTEHFGELMGGDPESNWFQAGAIGAPDVGDVARFAPLVGMMKLKNMKAGRGGKHAAASVVKRVKTKNKQGKVVGAPKGWDTDDKVAEIINEYADRVDRGLESTPRGWFYDEGAKAIDRVSDTADDAYDLAMANAITSSEAPVASNFDWSMSGLQQKQAGYPIKTGKYPVEMSAKLEDLTSGGDPYLGKKRHRYGHALAGEKDGLAPNDRWEVRSMHFPKDTVTPAQADWMDKTRRSAAEVVDARHAGQKGYKPIKDLEAQEFNWGVVRDDLGAGTTADNIQNAIENSTFQQSWESVPGKTTKHLQGMSDDDVWRMHGEVEDLFLDAGRKDRLTREFVGPYQDEAISGPGIYQGQVSPGTQSRPIVAKTIGGGLRDASRENLEAADATRALFLSQDAYGGHMVLPEKTAKHTDTYVLAYGRPRPINKTEAVKVGKLLQAEFGPDGATIVPTAKGVNVLNLGSDKFTKRMDDVILPQLDAALPAHEVGHGGRGKSSYFDELPWGEGKATETVLQKYKSPNARLHADSKEIRDLAGGLGEIYRRMEARGYSANPDLMKLLKAWSERGIAGAEDLVKAGAAPAFALVVLHSLLDDPAGKSPSHP